MHLLSEASLKNRALIALVTIVVALFGVISVGSLKQELMPSVQFPAVAVITSYPGASPEVVNNDVSEPIETALRAVPNLETTTATSSTGMSMVVAEFTYGVDIASTEQKVDRAVSRLSAVLPETADSSVMSGSLDDFPVIQIAVTPPDGTDSEETAKLVERIAIPELSDLDGVREAVLSGARGDRITITPDSALLEQNGLSSQSLTDTLQQSGVLVAAGTVTDEDRTLAVQAGSELESVEDVEALPIARSAADIAAWQAQQQAQAQQQSLETTQMPGGATTTQQQTTAPAMPPVTTIGEVAEVQLEPNPVQSISRVDGQPALTIGVTKMSAANTVDVSHAVLEAIPDLEDSLEGAGMQVIFDQAPYVEQSIETLTTEGLLGLVFAVLVILVFLMSMRATLVTAISIPTSVLVTIIGLNFADYSLNMLTLGALTISIGRVVDDSIVVIENIKRHLVEGAERGATIVHAVREVAGAITSSTVATMAVFLPIAFVGDMVGELFRPFSFTVALALAASLLVSLTIVPVLAYWFLKPDSYSRRPAFLKRKGVESLDEHDPNRVTAMQRGYRPIIEWTLKRPLVTLLATVVIFGATVGLAFTPLLKTNFLGDDEQNSVGLTQTLAPGTSLDEQLAQAERVEEALADVADIETLQVTMGGDTSGLGAIMGSGGDGVVSYSITTNPDASQSAVQDEIRSAVDALDEAGDFSIGSSDGGVTMSSAIAVNVSAPDQETLAEAAESVTEALREQDGLKQVESDLAASRPYLKIDIDRKKAADAGLSEAAAAMLVSQRMQPSQIGQITMGADNVSVYLAEGTAPDDQAGVAALSIPTAAGEKRLDSIATIEVADGPVNIRTEDAVRMVTVSALPEGDDLGTAGARVTAALDSVELPAGATASVGGVMAQQEDAFSQLGIALLAAILIVYVVMVATFRSLLQPLLLLVSVPLAATGAILLLIATGIPLGVASLIGVLMLIGIVVTNAIVLIDLVNQLRADGVELKEAVERGSLLRLRPIVMTALATILALTPMGLGITGKGGFISQPLAVVVIGGLLSSTLLTLVVLPTFYYAVERRREKRRARRQGGPIRRSRGPRSGAGGGAIAAGAGAGIAGAAIAVGASGDLGSETGTGVGSEAAHAAHAGSDAAVGPRRALREASPSQGVAGTVRTGPVPAAPVSAAPIPAASTPAASTPPEPVRAAAAAPGSPELEAEATAVEEVTVEEVEAEEIEAEEIQAVEVEAAEIAAGETAVEGTATAPAVPNTAPAAADETDDEGAPGADIDGEDIDDENADDEYEEEIVEPVTGELGVVLGELGIEAFQPVKNREELRDAGADQEAAEREAADGAHAAHAASEPEPAAPRVETKPIPVVASPAVEVPPREPSEPREPQRPVPPVPPVVLPAPSDPILDASDRNDADDTARMDPIRDLPDEAEEKPDLSVSTPVTGELAWDLLIGQALTEPEEVDDEPSAAPAPTKNVRDDRLWQALIEDRDTDDEK